jgi:hypothetical protein
MLKLWKRHFLHFEFALAVVLTICFAVWGYSYGGFSLVEEILSQNRSDVYGAIATIYGSLLGFVIVAVSVVANYSTASGMRIVRESKQYRTLWNVFLATIRTLGLATFVALVALVLDRNSDPARPVMVLVAFVTLLSIARVARSVWVLENVISIVVKSAGTDEENPQ